MKRWKPCPLVGPDGRHTPYTGLPGGACEECMNRGEVLSDEALIALEAVEEQGIGE